MPAPESQTDVHILATDNIQPRDLNNVEGKETDGTQEGPTEIEDEEEIARKKEEALRQTREMARLVGADQVDKMARFVKTFKPCVNVPDLDDPLLPPLLLVACQRNNLKMAQLLLSYTSDPVDVNAADVEGLRPLG